MSSVVRRGMLVVTGSGGFIGSSVIAAAARAGSPVRAVSRRPVQGHLGSVQYIAGADLREVRSWCGALEGADAVVHTAALVHSRGRETRSIEERYRVVNSIATEELARAAARAGVRRFIYLSSVKVNGDETNLGVPFTVDAQPNPADAYARSKYEAEQRLRTVASETGLDVVVIRPVLVYGPGVGSNFRTMMSALRVGLPLPFRDVKNLRSLVALPNLVDLILAVVRHPKSIERVLLVSDGEDLSTPELLHRTAAAMNTTARLFRMNPDLLSVTAKAFGQSARVGRLLGSLQVDIAETCATLRWQPRVTVDQALQGTVDHFLRETRG